MSDRLAITTNPSEQTMGKDPVEALLEGRGFVVVTVDATGRVRCWYRHGVVVARRADGAFGIFGFVAEALS